MYSVGNYLYDSVVQATKDTYNEVASIQGHANVGWDGVSVGVKSNNMQSSMGVSYGDKFGANIDASVYETLSAKGPTVLKAFQNLKFKGIMKNDPAAAKALQSVQLISGVMNDAAKAMGLNSPIDKLASRVEIEATVSQGVGISGSAYYGLQHRCKDGYYMAGAAASGIAKVASGGAGFGYHDSKKRIKIEMTFSCVSVTVIVHTKHKIF